MKKKRSFLVSSCDQEVTRAEAVPLCGVPSHSVLQILGKIHQIMLSVMSMYVCGLPL